MTVIQIAETAGLSVGSAQTILTKDLRVLGVCAKFVLLLLSNVQAYRRVTNVGDLFGQSMQDSSFFLAKW